MTSIMKTLSLSVAAGAIALAAPMATPSLESSAYAQEAQQQEKKTRKVPAMTLAAHREIQKAQELMAPEEEGETPDLPGAARVLDELLAKGRINDYEKAVAWQLKASIAFEQDDTPASIRAFEQILKYRDSIPEALELNILFSLSQLYYSIENYDRALTYAKEWEPRATIISVNQIVYISQLYYVRSEYPQSLDYIYRAINEAQALDTVEVKENWYGIALSSHWELNQYDKVRDVLELLIVTWPKPQYWLQLSGIYAELGRENDSYSITEAAYQQGFLDDKDTQLVNMAQILIARDAPIKAANVVERSYEKNLVERTPENERLLGQAYLRAAEYEKSIEPLKNAAEGLEDGDLWFQVGQVQSQLEDYRGAVESYTKAVAQMSKTESDRKKNHARILAAHVATGTSLIELKEFDDASAAMEKARKVASTRRERGQVDNWVKYLASERAREEILEEAGITAGR